jgi:hypothetical protein
MAKVPTSIARQLINIIFLGFTGGESCEGCSFPGKNIHLGISAGKMYSSYRRGYIQ